ncbi:unnamed protein product [Somion occarium]|uniref:CCHC-type domain-containing protein n=1 Tax=Somion occarium TaxID=3059160 RepID=A0ABP1D9R1_9APHY
MANQGEGNSPPPMEVVDDTPTLEEQVHSLQEQLLISEQHINHQQIIIQDVEQFRAQIQTSFSHILTSTTDAFNNELRCRSSSFQHPHSDNNRVVYALSYMKTGTAGKWAQLYDKKLADPNLPPPTWAQFEIDLCAKFADPNPKATAQRKIKTLHMDGTCDDYVLAFETYEDDTGYNDEALLGHFKTGLPYALRKQVATNGNPATLILWKRKALAHDREWRAYEADEKLIDVRARTSTKGNTNASTSGSTSAMSASTSQTPAHSDGTGTTFGGSGEPMDIDAYCRAGKCFTCGEKGHVARACPKNKGFSIRHLAGIVSVEEARGFVKEVEDKVEEENGGDVESKHDDSSDEDF